jgi:glycogen debranching enzyme
MPGRKLGAALVGGLLLVAAACVEQAAPPTFETPSVSLDELATPVTAEENRAVSFTNKRSAYYYTQTHVNDHPEHAWFRGLNIAQRRILGGYELSVDGVRLETEAAEALVSPDRLERRYAGGARETLRLFDEVDVVEVGLNGVTGTPSITLLGDQVTPAGSRDEIALFQTSEDPGKVIGVAGRSAGPLESDGLEVTTPAGADGFLIVIGESQEDAAALVEKARREIPDWSADRLARLRSVLEDGAYLRAEDTELTSALRWITLNLDQLVTRQHGAGIYAGLPWFNEYWGRDSFISLPGATLVTGQFEAAREILTSFAAFQDTVTESEFFGRMPNIVKPELIDYHTTDGTPRFVIQLLEYVRYSGDTSLVRELYPVVSRSIEGSLSNWVDEAGYLVHADNETWMDARRADDLMPYSPRGTRANDIQALWHAQLRAGVYFADLVGDAEAARRWDAAADRVRRRFEQDFRSPDRPYLADRLDGDETPDFRLRPNQLYAFDLVEDAEFRVGATRVAWEELVYPWGVASLDRGDPFFHPYHLRWESYHKDQAYHNGTVWLWNNGIAMQRMIEAGQPDVAFQLFENMNRLALARGVVGGLPENSDAYPKEGEAWPRLTGTYLQAWSNAEHLRVWYQVFLGIRPDMMRGELTLAPRLPSKIDELDYAVRIGDGVVRGLFRREDSVERHVYRFEGLEIRVALDIAPYHVISVNVGDGESLTVEREAAELRVRVYGPDGMLRREVRSEPSPERIDARNRWAEIMRGVEFAAPLSEAAHPVLQQASTDDRGI